MSLSEIHQHLCAELREAERTVERLRSAIKALGMSYVARGSTCPSEVLGALAAGPKTYAEIRAATPTRWPHGHYGNALASLFARGEITRTGSPQHYTYALAAKAAAE